MKKWWRLILFIIIIGALTFISIVYFSSHSRPQKKSINTLNETDAVYKVIKDNPDFPSKENITITKKLPTGGPLGAAENVKFTTKISKADNGTYIITLFKDWRFSFNGKYVKSYWKYRITTDSADLIEKEDNDNLPGQMK